MTKHISLTQGQVALVDDTDFDWLMQWKWTFQPAPFGYGGYAVHDSGPKNHRQRTAMHRLIMGAQVGQEIDHINGDKLDNRRVNLRFCTRSQNKANTPPMRNNSSGFKGIHHQRHGTPWRAQIRVNGKTQHLGQFPTPEQAALAYDQAAREHFGPFARCNFPEEA